MHCFVKFLAARLASIRDAVRGLVHVLRTQANARVHLFATMAVILFGVAVDLARADWLWLVTAIALVWVAEVFNTAIEYLCDVVSPEYSDAVKRAKDISAGAVLLAAIYAATVGAFVFLPHLTGG